MTSTEVALTPLTSGKTNPLLAGDLGGLLQSPLQPRESLFCFAAKPPLRSLPLDSLEVPIWSPMLEILYKQNLYHSPDRTLN